MNGTVVRLDRVSRSSTHCGKPKLALGVAPVEDRSRADERRRRDDEAGRPHEADPFEVRQDVRDRAWPRSSVRLRPEVDEPDRLDPLRPAPRRSRGSAAARVSRSRSNCSRRLRQERMLASSWRLSSSREVERELVEVPLVLGELFAHPLALALEGLAQVGRLPLAALAELLDRALRPVPRLAARAAAGALRRRAAPRRGAFAGLPSSGIGVASVAERLLEQVERLRLRLARVGVSGSVALRRLDPPRGDRDELLVQPLGAASVEESRPSRMTRGIESADLGEAGAREIVVDEALRAEAREQPLRDPLLEVQVDGVLGEHAGVLEDDRPDRRLAAPVGELLVLLARRAQSVSSVAAQLGSVAARPSSAGNVQTRPPVSSSVSSSGSAPRSSREQDRASRNGVGVEPGPRREASSRLRQRSICAFRSSWRSRAASSSSSTTLLPLCVEVGLLDLACERLGVACRMPLPRRRSMSSSITFERLPSSFLIVSVLLDEHLEHAVLDALGQHEVVAADLVGRLELAVDAAVALLDPARVPGQVEVEEVGAVRLEVQALAGRVGGDAGCAADPSPGRC